MSDLSDLPIPRYHIGQVVYFPLVDRTTETLPCPDCRGARHWRAISPAGEEHEIACPRCSDQYARSGRDNLPSLSIARHEPKILRLTIGSITAKTHPYSGDDGIEYMANETGVGSGSIYRESQLFESEAAARVTAGAEAAIKNAEIDATPRVTKARQFSGLTYTDAALVALKDGIFNSWQAFRSLGYAIESALPEDSNNDTGDQQAIREAIERYGKYGGTYLPVERHPIDALLEALDAEGAERSDAVREAINTLRRIAGIADHPENPPCTCRHIGLYSRESGCPRHGSGAAEI